MPIHLTQGFRFGSFTAEPLKGRITGDGMEPQHLPPKAMDVLVTLAEAAQEPLSRRELIDKVWGERCVSDEVLTHAIKDLRHAIGDLPSNPQYIRTIPKRGYQFLKTVEPLCGPVPAQNVARIRRIAPLIVFLIAVTIIAAVAVDTWWPRGPNEHSIAVLPFVNMSEDPNQEYFSDGITEEILNLLAQIPELRVISRSSSFLFKGQNLDIREIAEYLDVGYVIEGSVRKMGNQVRITVQLIESESGAHLWSQSYDRDLINIFAVQNEIAQQIVQELTTKFDSNEQRSLGLLRAATVEAYDYYLKGRSLFLQWTRRDFEDAEKLYTEAIRLDPGYAPAHAELSIVLSTYFRAYDSNEELLLRAEKSSQRAVELAPNYSRAHIARAHVLSLRQQFEEADLAYQTAVHLDPRSASVLYNYSIFTLSQRKYQQTANLLEKALKLDPLHKQSCSLLPVVYRHLGQDERAIRAYKRSAEVLELSLQFNPNDLGALLRLASARLELGDEKGALELADRVLQIAGEDAVLLYIAAGIYSRAGKTVTTLNILESSLEAGFADFSWISQDKDFDWIRGHPRFKEILRRTTTESDSSVVE